MELNEKRSVKYVYSFSVDKNGGLISVNDIANSYNNGFKENIEDNGNVGLRVPQFGALSSIRASWTISNDAITIVLPTGTGKSETMLAAILSEKIKRALVVVPNKLLRNQTYERARSWGILREIGCVDNDVLNPNTLCLKSGIKDLESFNTMVESSNIIVSTMPLVNKMSKEQIACLSAQCDLLVVDEAHHVSSKTWRELKKEFLNKKILQFTATPYRQDGKLVDGKIAYNFPMHMAIEQEYFKPIEFIAVEEYDENLVDKCIADQAIANLEIDVRSGLNHILLVRANTIERAEYLYENIYSNYSQFNPVIITSKVKASEKKERLSQIKIVKVELLYV